MNVVDITDDITDRRKKKWHVIVLYQIQAVVGADVLS